VNVKSYVAEVETVMNQKKGRYVVKIETAMNQKNIVMLLR